MTEELYIADPKGRFTYHAKQAIDDATEIFRQDSDASWAAEFVVTTVEALNRLHGLVPDDDDD